MRRFRLLDADVTDQSRWRFYEVNKNGVGICTSCREPLNTHFSWKFCPHCWVSVHAKLLCANFGVCKTCVAEELED